MTIEEKRTEIRGYCSGKLCTDCPLYDVKEGHCYSNATDEEITENYAKIFGDIQTDNTGNVDHPRHYNQGDIECIDAMIAAFGEEAVKEFCIVNAFKYVWRSRDKNGLEDIDKAIWYLNKFKELSENG